MTALSFLCDSAEALSRALAGRPCEYGPCPCAANKRPASRWCPVCRAAHHAQLCALALAEQVRRAEADDRCSMCRLNNPGGCDPRCPCCCHRPAHAPHLCDVLACRRAERQPGETVDLTEDFGGAP